MNNKFSLSNYNYRGVLVMSLLMFCVVFADAQVMWNLKGGVLSRKVKDWDYFDEYGTGEKTKHIEWQAGLELEIPLSRRLNIETGLRYANRFVAYLDDDSPYGDLRAENKHHIELPVRLAYKHDFGHNLSLHAGVGPYASYMIEAVGADNSFQVGLEPAVTLYWHNLNLGVSYNVPCFYKGYTNENRNAVMVTLGIRFKSKVWSYIGDGIIAAGEVASAFNDGMNGGGGNSNSYLSGGDDSDYSSSETSSGSNLLTQYRNWEQRAKANYNSLVNNGVRVKKKGKEVGGFSGQSLNGGNYTVQKRMLREAQNNMKNIRAKAAKQGITIPKSEYEDKVVRY